MNIDNKKRFFLLKALGKGFLWKGDMREAQRLLLVEKVGVGEQLFRIHFVEAAASKGSLENLKYRARMQNEREIGQNVVGLISLISSFENISITDFCIARFSFSGSSFLVYYSNQPVGLIGIIETKLA